MAAREKLSDIVTSFLDIVHDRLVSDRRGAVADYIPQLADADPELFGIALCGLNGRVYESGDTGVEFTIQSVSKPFVYSLALDDQGLDAVHDRVGAEPSGEAFNSVKLEAGTGRPPNPMVNAGAIVTTSLVSGNSAEDRFARILARLSAFAGRDLRVDDAVLSSEQASGDRNRALAYLMHGAGSLTTPVLDTLDTYFRQCSVLVTARDIAVMGATLANGGVNPVTGRRVTSAETCQHVMTIMATCGMYDYAGEWLLRAGLPAKSGVAGGLVASSPGEFGLGLFSPRLDSSGASVRGVAAAQQLATRFGLHVLHRPLTLSASEVMAANDELAAGLGAEQDAVAAQLLQENADDLAVWRLRGYIDFDGAERLLLDLDAWLDARPTDRDSPAVIVLDLTEVTQLQSVAVWMLAALATWCRARGMRVIASDPQGRSLGVAGLSQSAGFDDAVRDAAAMAGATADG
ncbi:glutaminase A [Microbacterium aerolatum]|uniref:glutaminase A n=1 Tax=Microbacterium aerolatum TaxID=153731 RepID=UPI002000C361|nr:glutaminase A [Microbacterium aerolatum]MCK3769679.1 glutaminase A [Microbacterium aerolatum]